MSKNPMKRIALSTAAIVAVCFGGCQSLDKYNNKPKTKSASSTSSGATMSPDSVGKAPAVSVDRKGEASKTDGQGLVQRGSSLASQGQYELALAEFEKAIEVNPKLTTAYMGAGDIYRQRGSYDQAEKRYGKAAELEPGNFNAQYLHGLMLQLLNRVNESVRAYLRAIQIKPDDFNSNLNLATAYLQLGEPAEALPYGQKAVQLNGKSAPARTNLGAILASLGRHEEAVVEYQQAAELAELSAPLLLNLAESLGKTGRYEEMVNTLTQLVKTEPTAVAYERLGFGLFRLRQYPDSLAAFRKAVEIDPNHYPALNGIGACLLNQWEWSKQTDEAAKTEAIRALRRSLQIEPQQPRILELLGRYR